MDNSHIPWTTHTFNGWEGCEGVAPECWHCYAEDQTLRWHPDLRLWGPESNRLEHKEDYWKKPLKWNIEALKTLFSPDDERTYVFCGSMMDVCDIHPTAQKLRPRLIETIESTTNLTWQLLSKRPGLYKRFYWDQWPEHVWAGTSAGCERSARVMLRDLIKVDAPIRFVSIEPLIEFYDLRPYLPYLDWVIIGGESGTGPECEPGKELEPGQGIRPMKLEWVEQMVEQCQIAGVSVFVKQMGTIWARKMKAQGIKVDTKGEFCVEQWPANLRVQQFPAINPNRANPYSGLIAA